MTVVGRVISIPFDTKLARAGDNATLPCNPVVDATVHWAKYDTEHGTVREISQFGRMMNDSIGRFTLSRRSLVIMNSTTTDSGLYRCTEDDGAGQKHLVLLSVSGKIFVTLHCD